MFVVIVPRVGPQAAPSLSVCVCVCVCRMISIRSLERVASAPFSASKKEKRHMTCFLEIGFLWISVSV